MTQEQVRIISYLLIGICAGLMFAALLVDLRIAAEEPSSPEKQEEHSPKKEKEEHRYESNPQGA